MLRPPLLITASLDAGHTPQVALRGGEERTIRYMEGLIAWFRDSSIQQIVFAKNCGLQIRSKILQEVASSHGKELEFIQVESSARTVYQGKGFGEGDIIKQALKQSEILRGAEDFIKITGKLYAPGSENVFPGKDPGEFYLVANESAENVSWSRRFIAPLYKNPRAGNFLGFLRRGIRVPWGLIAATPSGWMDTRFYRVSRSLYQESLLHSHERVQDALGYTLENAFHDDLDYQEGIRMISSTPVIIGTSGTLGTTAAEFTPEIRMEAKELAGRLLGKR